jgi:excisionase family DNA binding protein
MITGREGGGVQPSQAVAGAPKNFTTRLLPEFAAGDMGTDAAAVRTRARAGWGAPGTAPRIATTPTTADLYGFRGGPDSLLAPAEVARRLRLCTETVRRLCRKGELPHVRIVDNVRIRPADLAAFVSSRRHSGRPP